MDETIANNEFEDASSKWDEADVLLLTNCSDLTVRLQSFQDSIADKFDGKVLIIQHIDKLYMPEFLAGAPYGDFKSVFVNANPDKVKCITKNIIYFSFLRLNFDI